MEDIEDFKNKNDVDQVIILWTANTERFSDVIEGVHDTAGNLKSAISGNHPEISPSTLFAFAAIQMKVNFSTLKQMRDKLINTFYRDASEKNKKKNYRFLFLFLLLVRLHQWLAAKYLRTRDRGIGAEGGRFYRRR